MTILINISIALLLALFPGSIALQSRKPTASEVTESIRKNFGSQVKVITESPPYYLLGDFNGDGFRDIAVTVNPEGAQQEIKNAGVKYLDVDPSSETNGQELSVTDAEFKYCVGVAIMHGTADGPVLEKPGAKYLFYECFVPFKLIPRSTKLRRFRGEKQPPPKLRGDAIYLYLERDAASVVYWTGQTYRGYYQSH